MSQKGCRERCCKLSVSHMDTSRGELSLSCSLFTESKLLAGQGLWPRAMEEPAALTWGPGGSVPHNNHGDPVHEVCRALPVFGLSGCFPRLTLRRKSCISDTIVTCPGHAAGHSRPKAHACRGLEPFRDQRAAPCPWPGHLAGPVLLQENHSNTFPF